MRNRSSARLYVTSASIVFIMISLLLANTLLSNTRALGTDSVTGAIWTSDPHGERVNGNLYTNARKVYVCGGPHKEGSAGLPDGTYYFQVTDPAGKTLLSTDHISKRQFEAKNGYIFDIGDGKHKWNNDTTRGYGIVVQLYPFTFKPRNGGVYKVWVTNVNHYASGQGCFGFIPSLSKTDNFKVKMDDEVPKYFELWVTEKICEPQDVEFHVNYTTDGDGDVSTFDPVLPWASGRLWWDRDENGYSVFRYETSFAMGSYIYWQFIVTNSFTWISEVYGPESIDQEGMVNKEILFTVDGHKFNLVDGAGLENWMIEFYSDGTRIDEALTGLDGAYMFIGAGTGDYAVCEVAKDDEGWANATPTCYEFTVDGSNGRDFTFDFYNYKMLRITDTSEFRCELPYFEVVFTPSNEESPTGEPLYKLSSTNPGSFYTNVVKYGEPNSDLKIEIRLPRDQENADYDSPNFVVHHTYIGSTPIVDVHVYAGRQQDASPCGSEFVPDWETDITNLFDISVTADGKNVTIIGEMPETGEVFATVHIDYQISASLTWNQVQTLIDEFVYTFSDTVYFSIQGVTMSLGVRR